MTTIFGIYATGSATAGWAFRMTSKVLFTSREAAEAYFHEFADKCCDCANLNNAHRETLKLRLIEYELRDEQAAVPL